MNATICNYRQFFVGQKMVNLELPAVATLMDVANREDADYFILLRG